MHSRTSKVLVALATVAVVVPASSATAASAAGPASHVQPGTYTGTTSQGQSIQFNVVEGGDNDFIDSWSVGFNLTCEKTGRELGVGHGFGGFNVAIDPDTHKFKFAYEDTFYFYFKWSGTFTSATAAKGKAQVTWGAVYDQGKEAERCPSGKVTWTATHAAQGTPLNPADFDKFITATRDSAGDTFKITSVK